MNPLDLSGKTVVVTGSSGFLASQFVPFLRKMGATVHGMDTRGDPPVDITDPIAVSEFIGKLVTDEDVYGIVHAAALDAIPGAANPQFAPYEEFSLELWEKALHVNLTAAQVVTQAVAPHLMRKKAGSIVFIASDLALIAPDNSLYERGMFKDISYVTSKAGMLGLMRAWAAYLGSFGVRANALVPGGMRHGHTDSFALAAGSLSMLGRMAQPGEYDAAIAFLLSDASSYMTGSSLVIDGGRTAR